MDATRNTESNLGVSLSSLKMDTNGDTNDYPVSDDVCSLPKELMIEENRNQGLSSSKGPVDANGTVKSGSSDDDGEILASKILRVEQM